jgi:hypothetical protein
MRPSQRAQKRLSLPLKKNVQFSSMSSLVIFEHSPCPSDGWYTDDDHRTFRQEQKRDILSFREQLRRNDESTPSSSTSSSCPVGLEQHIFSQNFFNAYVCRRTVVQSVMLEQNRQRLLGHRDPGMIASLAERLTAESCVHAQLRGKYQEESAKIVVQDMCVTYDIIR